MTPATVITVIEALISVFWRARKIRNEVLPLVEEASKIAGSDTLTNNESRREYVVRSLISQGIPESSARLLTEAGVKLWKKIQAKAEKKAAKAEKKAAKAAKLAKENA